VQADHHLLDHQAADAMREAYLIGGAPPRPRSARTRPRSPTPGNAGPRIVEPRATPPRHAGRNHARTRTRYPETDSKGDTEHEHRKTPGNHKHLKSVVLVSYAPSKIEKPRYRYRFVANRSSSAADCLRVSIK
jgi:hypothetical protein